MNSNATSPPQRIRERLAGHHILVTGSTGFLAKAFVEKLLRAVDTIGGIHLLVRVRSDGTSARHRVMREVLGSRAFDRLRASLGEGFARLCDEKIHVVGGDLTKERLGLDREIYDALTERITLVVNSAATVTFDERIDLAVELNALGPRRLLRFAIDCGHIPFLHVSTCYVCGARRGTVIEDFSAPEGARETLPHRPGGGGFDLDGLIDLMRAEAAELRHRFGADTEVCRRQLIEAGMHRARSYGWNDTYTFTKWIGEQILIRDRGDVPLVIFRPAIIEGSFDEPTPGWIDGLRMADPIIVAFGRGKLNEFPAVTDIAIDLIPVDFVANAMIAALPVGEGWHHGLAVYHCSSSDRNPLCLRDMSTSLEKAFRKRPMSDDDGRPVRAGRLNLVDQETFLSRWQTRQRRVAFLQKAFNVIGLRGRRFRKLSAIARQIEQVIYFGQIYSPYTHIDCRFADDALRSVAEKLHPDDRAAFPFDTGRIDWDDYLVNRHVPGLRSFVLGSAGDPSPRILAAGEWDRAGPSAAAEALQGANLFDVFRRAAERFGGKPALQIRREGRWLRYTYDEAMHATGAIMRRFGEHGLNPGDRVAICGESGPEWGLAYLAAMRAGLTTIPLDPQLPPPDAWSAARFAEARLMCATPTTSPGLAQHRLDGDAEMVTMREPFIPRPAASRDTAPDPVPVDDTAVASILFTSGTTVSPKAVLLTHRNFIANATALLKVHPVSPADQLLSVLPMYHAFEFTGGFWVPLVSGATITYVEQLKGPEIMSVMQATGTTIMLVVPRLLRMFSDSIATTVAGSGRLARATFRFLGFLSDLTGHRLGRRLFGTVHKRFGGGLRMFVSGGSRLDPELFEAFRRMGFEVYEGYGLTETSPVLTVNPPGRAKPGSVGPALPGIELEIRNQNLERIGEVWVRGPGVMSGYLNNPEATGEILVDGWLRTGDLGRRDADGYLCLTGRSKDLIVTAAGKNVYPDEVEVRYRDLPYTKEFCVFGMPSEDGLGDTVHAVVVADEGVAPELDRSSIEREVRSAAASISESLPTHERIMTLHFWDRELPKTSTLKAKRGLIRDMVLTEKTVSTVDASEAGAASPDARGAGALGATEDKTAKFAAVRRILSNQCKHSELAIDRNMHLLLDLGIDSIGKMDVLGAVEVRFGMRIDNETAAKIARVSDLLTIIGDRRPKDGLRGPGALPRRLGEERHAPSYVNGSLPAPLVPLRWLVRGGIVAFMNTYVRVRVNGRENIPATGAFILAPNHSSHLDSPSVLTAVGRQRRVWIVGAEDYFFGSALKRLVFGKLLDTIPFDRQADGVRGLRRCGQALSRGDGLLIFPEGTRSTTGELQPFKVGVAVLAVEQEVPIIPVYIDRAYDLFRKGQRFVRPGKITVTFGQPVEPSELDESADRHVALRALAQKVEAAVDALANGASA
ncbi:MAG: AMP-binding protein [Phycisphaerae bacterium]